MSPRPGGEAAKFGERFEGRWTVRHLLDVLLGQAESVVVEAIDDDGESVEFFVTAAGVEQGHQVKRQWRGNATWPVPLLQRQGILRDAAAHVGAGRDFHFVSTLPSIDLDALADVARRSDTNSQFAAHLDRLSSARRAAFDVLAIEWGGRESAYEVLRKVYVWSPDERQLERDNLTFADWLIDGPPSAAVAVLGQIALDELTATLSSERLWLELAERGLRRNPLFDDTTLRTLVAEQTDRWLHTVTRELLQPAISRSQTDEVVALLRAAATPVMVAGEAGIGKSAVVGAVVDSLRSDGWPVLAFRLDRASDAQTPRQLGNRFDLPASPVIALGSVARNGPALFVCDQLDAASRASGRVTEAFDVLDELLREVQRFPNVRVLLACRQFDIDNDQRLRALVDPSRSNPAAVVTVPPLDADAVIAAVNVMGFDAAHLSTSQIGLLRSPFNLVLLREAASDVDALTFATVTDLLERYWQTKRRQVSERRLPRETRYDAVIERLVIAMSESQRLAVPESVLFADGLDDDAAALASEHMIVHENGRYAFFHEALFDYAFVRGWLSTNRSVLEFLHAGEQELFRRAQVRQVLTHLKGRDRSRFTSEVHALLEDEQVRFHVKDVVLALVRALDDPTSEELQLVLDILDGDFIWRDRVELLLRTTPWFDRLEADGVFSRWLASGDAALENRAVATIGIGGRERADRVAELLAPHESHADFADWLLFCVRFINLENSRQLFDLLLRAIRAGRLDGREDQIWTSAHSLGEKAPGWTIELLKAWLVERPAALSVSDARVADLDSGDYGLLELVRQAAAGAPAEFAAALLPYMQRVMELTATGDERPRGDWHFGAPIWNQHISRLSDALYAAMRVALAQAAERDPERLRALLEPLVDDPHQASQNLLYDGLRAAGAMHADWAADLLLRGDYALQAGYSDDHHWITRQLLEATTPHMDARRVALVEAALIAYVPEWEGHEPRWRGHASFTLLSGVDESRLSDGGRTALAQLRRKFERDEPEPPRGIVGGIVGSPISIEEARPMSDEQWRAAMRKYDGQHREMHGDLRGGAHELATQVVQPLTTEDPDRFARLALTIDDSYDASYLDSILIGLAQSEGDFDPEAVYDAIRHAATVGEHRRWLGYALQRLYEAEIPVDIVGLIIDRASTGTGDHNGSDDPYTAGINNVRGANVHTLAILVSTDESGGRAALVEPHIDAILETTSTAVRSTAAELLRALFTWSPERAVAGFSTLAETHDIRLFTTRQFEDLAAATVVRDVGAALPLIRWLLDHEDESARERGARLATFAATDAEREELLAEIVESADVATRRGGAAVLADRARWVTDDAVHNNLARLFYDEEETVREAAARVVMHLRGADLTKYQHLLDAFIGSPALAGEIGQLALTLERDRGEIVELTLEFARRFLDLFDREAGNIQTRAAGDARQIGELVLRAYTQAPDADRRTEILDLVDRLLELNTHGFDEAVEEVGRHG